MPPLFDAGVPLEALPWGVEGDAPVSSRSFNYKAEDGETDLEAYFAWDPSLLEGGDEGLPGVLVAHTAIGPQEVFVHTCCDALARIFRSPHSDEQAARPSRSPTRNPSSNLNTTL